MAKKTPEQRVQEKEVRFLQENPELSFVKDNYPLVWKLCLDKRSKLKNMIVSALNNPNYAQSQISLKSLKLHENTEEEIAALIVFFLKNTKRRNIDISDNGLESIPKIFSEGYPDENHLEECTSIKLNKNNLSKIGADDFKQMTGLKELNLGFNPGIDQIDDKFVTPFKDSIERICLSCSDQCQLGLRFLNEMPNLQQIDIHKLAITKLPENIFSSCNLISVCINDRTAENSILSLLNINPARDHLVIELEKYRAIENRSYFFLFVKACLPPNSQETLLSILSECPVSIPIDKVKLSNLKTCVNEIKSRLKNDLFIVAQEKLSNTTRVKDFFAENDPEKKLKLEFQDEKILEAVLDIFNQESHLRDLADPEVREQIASIYFENKQRIGLIEEANKSFFGNLANLIKDAINPKTDKPIAKNSHTETLGKRGFDAFSAPTGQRDNEGGGHVERSEAKKKPHRYNFRSGR